MTSTPAPPPLRSRSASSGGATAPLLVLLAVLAPHLAGCAVNLMPTPNVVAQRGVDAFAQVPESRCTPCAPILFATDRNRLDEDAPVQWYGIERSTSLAYGRCAVEFGTDLDWNSLVKSSAASFRPAPLGLGIKSVEESGRFPITPVAIGLSEGLPVVSSEAAAEIDLAESRFGAMLADELSCDDSGRVLLYVHGYNNTFRDACVVAGQLWHFLGRRGVVVAYSWPAGIGGLRGYTHDRESGEFTIVHLKQLIRAIAACPQVKQLDILAHSRGADVATTALRELHLETAAQSRSTRTTLKLGHLVLAAPDLDVQIVGQRIVGEGLHLVPKSFTVYFSADDNAIGLANWLFLGAVRLGGLAPGTLSRQILEGFQRYSDRITFIDVRVPTGFFGHSYFYESPAVSSDLVLLLGEDREPGAEHGRPLKHDEVGFWLIDADYPEFETAGVNEAAADSTRTFEVEPR
ncbi:MAG: alpha/beta hydrolase [Phycisphaerales bacterium]|nr:alpha/beta hydrolase [Phycisphaerales bacterium]